jgi:hypothetical protein
MARDEAFPADPTCERCDAPLVDTRSAVVRDGQTYCCVSCARAEAADIKVRPGGAPHGTACSRCGAPVVDKRTAVTEGSHLFCCGNCSAAGIHAEPLPEG